MELKHRCKDLWHQLQQLHAEITSIEGMPTALNGIVTSNQESQTLCFTELNTKFMDITLEAQNSVLENSGMPLFSDKASLNENQKCVLDSLGMFQFLDKASLNEMLKSELSSELDNLQQAESLLRAQRLEFDEEITRLTELKLNFLKFKGSLEERLKATSTTEVSSDCDLNGLSRENSQLKAFAARRRCQMKEFIGEHYPPPTPEQIEESRKKRGSGSKKTGETLYSLSEIIDQLMKRSAEFPEDPYIALGDAFWPPYVGLLQRSGTVSKHPEKTENIRLTQYEQ